MGVAEEDRTLEDSTSAVLVPFTNSRGETRIVDTRKAAVVRMAVQTQAWQVFQI
jgi:hypothetical protein